MLATQDLIKEAAQSYRLGQLLPRWLREVPLYQRAGGLSRLSDEAVPLAELRRLPLITKHDIRRDFPHNFLRAGVELDTLLDQDLVELEHTSGTSEERTPLLLGRGWWAEQEERALRLNPYVAGGARRVSRGAPRDDQLARLQRRHLLLGHAVARGPRRRQRAIRQPVALSVPLERSRPGAHGSGNGRMAAAVPRRGPGLWGAVCALLRAAGHPPALAAVHPVQLRVCERRAPADSGARRSACRCSTSTAPPRPATC